jgi:uncharacterized protein (DUF1778 family)
MAVRSRARDRRLEIRTTEEERQSIDRAAAAAGIDLTSFVTSHLMIAARQVLADRDHFVLTPEAAERWDALNAQPARELPGLRKFMERPSPFSE